MTWYFFSKSLATSWAVSCRLGQVWITVVAIALRAVLSAALGNGWVCVEFIALSFLENSNAEDAALVR